MIDDLNIYKMRTHINKQIIETIPDRKTFEEFQEKRISHAIGEGIYKKVKFTWEDDDQTYSKVLTGEVAVLHVDEYKKLLNELQKYKEMHEMSVMRGRFI